MAESKGKYLVTIIIPCYNMGAYILDTIKSVDTYYNPEIHEVIIVNDGSKDTETLRILDELSQSQKYQIIHQENQGLSAARNTGINNAAGEYLIFLDSDNLLTAAYLTEGVKILDENLEVDIVYGVSEKFGEENGFLPTEPYNLQTLMLYNYIDACTLVRKSAFASTGLFDTNMKKGLEDWEMWLRMSYCRRKFHYMPGVIVQKYRVRKNSMIRSVSKKNYDDIFDYLSHKYKDFLNYELVTHFYYSKFNKNPFFWTLKLYIRKYLPSLDRRLLKKNIVSKYL